MAQRQPDYELSMLDKATEQRGRVGAAWKNKDGRISIVLNPCVVLHSSGNMILNLFPISPRNHKYARDTRDPQAEFETEQKRAQVLLDSLSIEDDDPEPAPF